MLFRLGSLRLTTVNPWNRVLSLKSFGKPKKVHHAFIKASSFTSSSVNYKSIKQNEAKQNIQEENSIIITAYKKFQKSPYVRLMRLDRPIGSLLLFWPCGWSIGLAASAGCTPDLSLLAIFAAGSVVMRSAGCIINDMWDKDIDSKVTRTTNRPLVTKELTYLDAWFLLGSQLGIATLLLLELNWNSIILGASSLGLIIIYPLMKRIINWPQLVLGLTFNWGALLGYCAVHGDVNWAACLPLYTAGVCWTIIYDTIYAHQDRLDDLIVGVKSTALRFGRDTKKWLTGFSGVMGASLLTTGLVCDMQWPYYASLSLIAAHIGHQIFTLNIDDPTDCARKFLSNNQVGLLLFLGVVFGVLLQNPDTVKKDTAQILQSINSPHFVKLQSGDDKK